MDPTRLAGSCIGLCRYPWGHDVTVLPPLRVNHTKPLPFFSTEVDLFSVIEAVDFTILGPGPAPDREESVARGVESFHHPVSAASIKVRIGFDYYWDLRSLARFLGQELVTVLIEATAAQMASEPIRVFI